jgi:hypothetical protein
MGCVDRLGTRAIRRGRGEIWLRLVGTLALLCVLLPGCTSKTADVGGDGTPTQSGEPTLTTWTPSSPPTLWTPPATAIPTRLPTTKRPTATPTRPPATKPPTATPSREQTSQEKARERAKKELADGLVVYNPPDSAVVDDEFQLTVRVQRGTTPGSTFTELPGSAPVVTEKVPVGTYMVADLGGATFDTALIGPRKQLLIDEAAEWVWKVRPRAAGSQLLVLTLNAELDGEPVGGTRVLRRELRVGVAAAVERSWSQRFFGWGGWGEILVTVLAAAVLGVWKKGAAVRRWVKLRTKRPAQPLPDPAAPPPDPPSPSPDPAAQPDPPLPQVAAKKAVGPPQS